MKINYLLFAILSSIQCYANMIQPLFIQDHSDYPIIDESESNNDQTSPSSWFDFDKVDQNFILETKKIEIPGHPYAFNPSIVRWRGALLMSFRTYHPLTRSTNPFGLVWLNDHFEPISTPQLFELPFKNPVLFSKQQDPRLIIAGEQLFVAYNNILENVTHREMRRMFLAEIQFDGMNFTASEPECLQHFDGENEMRYEKNWVPFEYEDKLHLGYSIIPHRILRPLFGTRTCETLCSAKKNFKWNWGVPRGGTQAILDGDHYIAFFHSWVDVPSVQSGGKKITHYVMGAYTFESKPPFALLAVSPEPIVAKDFYHPPYYRTWKPLRCVFPSGLLVDENYFWVAYGRQDHECWVAKIDKKELLKSLIPVSTQ
jgi:predicted GH43/DUF377 family glycosyl hydrolase